MVTSHSVLLFADPVPCLITQTKLRISLGLFTESVSSSRGALFLGQRDRLLLFSFLLTLSSFSDDVNDVMSQAAAVAVMWQPQHSLDTRRPGLRSKVFTTLELQKERAHSRSWKPARKPLVEPWVEKEIWFIMKCLNGECDF